MEDLKKYFDGLVEAGFMLDTVERGYKKYQVSLGGSDIAALTLSGLTEEGLAANILKFGEDGEYRAYVVMENMEIPEHYELAHTFTNWVKVFSDEGLEVIFRGKKNRILQSWSKGDFSKDYKVKRGALRTPLLKASTKLHYSQTNIQAIY